MARAFAGEMERRRQGAGALATRGLFFRVGMLSERRERRGDGAIEEMGRCAEKMRMSRSAGRRILVGGRLR